MRRAALALVAALAGCATSRTAPVVLRPEPVAYIDTLPIPEPKEQKENRVVRTLLDHVPLQLAGPFDPGEGEALDVTHDDDVVGSSWWERRIGYRSITPEELANGPSLPDGPPATSGVLTVKSLKTQGVTPGLTLKDANGHTYIVKFDPRGLPHLQSAAGVIGNRLIWGAGYYVPEDYVMEFDADRLVVDPKARIVVDQVERPLTLEDVHQLLSLTHPIEGSRYLALASKYVPGTPKGPFFFNGSRRDDPNDHFSHEHRRELRALLVMSAWINDDDIREGNTLDVFVKPGYLRHYLLDQSSGLGSASNIAKAPKDGAQWLVDPYRIVARFATLGLYRAAWEDLDPSVISPELGYMPRDFDPADWKPRGTNTAFANMTAADAYWAAKILAAFTDDHIRAAVAAGQLSATAAATLTRMLAERRDRLVGYYFARVSTVEEPLVARQSPNALRLSFRDLGLEKAAWTADGTTYDWRFSDPARGRSGSGAAQPRASGDQLMDVRWTGDGSENSDELARLTIVTRRPGLTPDPATVFLRWTGQGYQVAGITHGDPDH